MTKSLAIASPTVAFRPKDPALVSLGGAQALIVLILTRLGNKKTTGYEIVRQSNGELSIGSIYQHLDRLVALGVLRQEFEELPPNVNRAKKRHVWLAEGEVAVLAPQPNAAKEGAKNGGKKTSKLDTRPRASARSTQTLLVPRVVGSTS